MNAPVTLAAEGLPRRAFSVADVERMVEVGLLDPDERIELIGGELVPMSPKGAQHEVLKNMLLEELILIIQRKAIVATETAFRLSDDTYLEPDVVIFPRETGFSGLTGPTAALVIEIADSSLGYDLGRKAALYAEYGIRELWVINARTRTATVHRDPARGQYKTVLTITGDMPLEACFVPDLIVCLSNLDRPE